jgi:putative two-component system response regulator
MRQVHRSAPGTAINPGRDVWQLTDMRILIVDDNHTNLEVIKHILRHDAYTNLLGTQDPAGVAHLCAAWQPDLVLLDLHMPEVTGYQVMAEISDLMSGPDTLPVLVVTADGSLAARHRALSMGARDFITKPLDRVELLLRVRNLLRTRQLQHELEHRNAHLDRAVRERNVELEQARRESLMILASAAEYHDDDTHHHTRRVGVCAAQIALALRMPEPLVADLRDAAALHDIGKIGISRRILLTPDVLTTAERESMSRHVEVGAHILASAHAPVLRLAAEIARTHHERWDGSGYLLGLAGEAIPLAGRITAVADVFDALTHRRPYKPAWDTDDAVQEIRNQSGRQFDPDVVAAFLTLDPDALVDGSDQRIATPGRVLPLRALS